MKNKLIAGLLLFAAWTGAGLSTPAVFTRFYRGPSEETRYRTEARVETDENNLIFTVKCFQPQTTLQASAKLRDRDVYNDDCVEIYIDKEGKARDYQQYIVNPLGTLQDLRFRKKKWDSEGNASGKIMPDHWIVTLRIPLTEIAGDNEVENGNVCVRINICRTVTGKKYGESLLKGGAYGKMRDFVRLELTGIGPEKLRQASLARLRGKGIDTVKLEKVSGRKFYELAAAEEEKMLKKHFKTLPEGVTYSFAYPTNVIPNPKFEYVNGKGEPANWLKMGTGECKVTDAGLELRSGGKLELWQETQPILDNKRTYALRAKLRSVSGKNRFKINLTGVDRSIRKLGMEKVVKTLESPVFENSGQWQDFEYAFELPRSAFRADAGIIVENGELQIKEVELDLLGKEDREIILSMLGYHRNGYKDAVVWSRKGGLSPDFELLENGKTVYRGKAKIFPGKPYGREAWVADFSDFRQEGVFRLKTNGMTSHPFKIGKTVYLDGMRFLLNGFYYQRQGFAQPGWKKKPDYMDDAWIVPYELRGKPNRLYLPDGKLDPKHILGHRDLSGGWRDAGDCSKQASDTESVYMLARVLDRLNPPWNLRKGVLPDLPDEIWWGVSRWVNKCYMGDGTFLDLAVNVSKLSHRWIGDAPEDCTDGIPETADDRIVYAVRTADGKYRGSLLNHWSHLHTIGLTGIAFRKIDPEIAAQCTRVMEGYCKKLQKEYDRLGLAEKKNWSRSDLVITGAKLAYSAIYLYRLTGREEYRKTADRIIVKIMKMAEHLDGRKFDLNSSFHATLHYFNVLIEYAEFYPESPMMPELKKAVSVYLEKLILPGYDKDELFPVFHHDLLCRKYGKTGSRNVIHIHTLAVMTLLRAGRILGTREYEILAEKGMQYWMGRNPQNLCEVSGLGWRYTALMTGLAYCKGNEDAVIPGIMANGFRVLNFMPILAKPSAVDPGGNMATAYGVEAWLQPTGMMIGLMGELEQINRRRK